MDHEGTTYEPAPELLREHMSIVHRVVAQLGRRLPRSISREDLVAAGTLGLYQALKKGAPESPAMFTTYASIRVRGAVYDELRRLDWFPRRRPTGDRTVEDSTEADAVREAKARARERSLVCLDELEVAAPLASVDGTPSDHVENKESLLALRKAVDALPERERAVIDMRYFRGMTGKAVASELGLSEARVSQLHARAIDLLRLVVDGVGALPNAA